jgi:hypothetical protein
LKGAATIRETSGDPGRNFPDLSANGNAHCTIWHASAKTWELKIPDI